MPDRLDYKITAFVAELVDDPPPAPDLDLDAVRAAAPLESAVPRFRLRDVAVAVAAFVAVVVAVGVVVLVPWGGGIEPQQPATTQPPPTTTAVPTTVAASFHPLIGFEMLHVEELPAGSYWTRELASGVQVGWCSGEGLSDEEPLAGLSDRAVARFSNGTAGIDHVVFADNLAAAWAAFEEVHQRTLSCLDDPARWVPPEVDGQVIDLSEMPLNAFGDDRFGVRYTATAGSDRAEGFLAVVLNGSRIIVVQTQALSEPSDQTDPVTRDDFEALLVTAVARSNGTQLDEGPADAEMLTTSDLPAHLNWFVHDESEGDSVGGWGAFEHGVSAVRCEEWEPQTWDLTSWILEPGPRSRNSDEPWLPLDDVRFKAMYTDTDLTAVVGEALYVDSPDTVEYVFNAMKTVTIDCFDSGITGWGNEGESSRLVLPPIGDDAIAVKVTRPLSPDPSRTRYDLFRLAIIRDGTRLLIVEEHELVMSPDDPPQVSDAEYMAIVQTAADRLDPHD